MTVLRSRRRTTGQPRSWRGFGYPEKAGIEIEVAREASYGRTVLIGTLPFSVRTFKKDG